MTVTKDSLIEAVANETGFLKKQSVDFVETLIELIKKTLASREDIMISGFGKFCVQKKKERRGRNPYTGEPLMLKPRRIVTFKCSGKLRKKIN